MVQRVSNAAYLTVTEPPPLDNVGWTVRVLSERDYSTVIAHIERFVSLGVTDEANFEGGGTVTLDSDDPVLKAALPVGETNRLLDQEALWQVLEDGQVRCEFLAEDLDEDVIPKGGGPRQTVVAGRGTGTVLEWAPVLPAGMPRPTSMVREFKAHPMTAWVRLFRDAQADGYLEWVTLLFTETEDSAGQPWGAVQEVTANAGENLLDLLKRWCEANELSWRMLPGFRLQVFKNPGNHLEGKVVFTQYRSQNEHTRKASRRELANIVYVSSGTMDNPETETDESADVVDDPETETDESRDVVAFGIATAVDVPSQERWRKRAAWVSAGDATDESARSTIANSTLSLSRDQKLSRKVKIIPDRDGRRPWDDFDLHDWVTIEVPDDDTASGVSKVVGIAVAVDHDGYVEAEATFQSRFDARAVKVQRLLDKLGGSTRSGAGAPAGSPVAVQKALASVRFAELADVDLSNLRSGSIPRYNGARWVNVIPNLDFLADVDTGTIPASGDVALVLDRASGVWKPGGVEASSIPSADSDTLGGIKLAGDLGGTADAPTVPALAGKAAAARKITAGAGLTGGGDLTADRTLAVDFADGGASTKATRSDDPRLSDTRTPTTHSHPVTELSAGGTRDASTFLRGDGVWAVPPTSGGTSPAPDATTDTKGILRLAGDLGGTADAPTVPGLAGKIPATEKGLAGGVATLGVDGKVPAGQLPAASGGGVTTLDGLDDVDTSSTPPTTGQALVWGGTAWTPGDVAAGGGGSGGDVDGGSPDSVYLPTQVLDGGTP